MRRVIVKSSDPIELSGFCDRVIVLSRGRIKDEIPHDELSEKRIIEAIVGSRAIAAPRTDRPLSAEAARGAPGLGGSGTSAPRLDATRAARASCCSRIGGYTHR